MQICSCGEWGFPGRIYLHTKALPYIAPNTERPSTVEVGTNILVKFTIEAIAEEINKIKAGEFRREVSLSFGMEWHKKNS